MIRVPVGLNQTFLWTCIQLQTEQEQKALSRVFLMTAFSCVAKAEGQFFFFLKKRSTSALLFFFFLESYHSHTQVPKATMTATTFRVVSMPTFLWLLSFSSFPFFVIISTYKARNFTFKQTRTTLSHFSICCILLKHKMYLKRIASMRFPFNSHVALVYCSWCSWQPPNAY